MEAGVNTNICRKCSGNDALRNEKGSGLEDSECFRGTESVYRRRARIVYFKEEKPTFPLQTPLL